MSSFGKLKTAGNKVARWIFIVVGICVAVFFLAFGGFIAYLTYHEHAKLYSGNIQNASPNDILFYQSIDVIKVQVALLEYKQEAGQYPSSLTALVPRYFSSVPIDTATHLPYQYTVNTNGAGYSLCPQPLNNTPHCASASATLTGESFPNGKAN